MQRVIVLPTHHVADDGVSIDLSGDRFHIGGSERAEVAEDEMQLKIEGGNKGKHQALLPNTTVEKRLGDFTLAAKFETAGDCHCFDDERRSISRSALSVSFQPMFWR